MQYTQNLNLFKYDVVEDGKEVFSIDQAMNENWDKIDNIAGTITTQSNTINTLNAQVADLYARSDNTGGSLTDIYNNHLTNLWNRVNANPRYITTHVQHETGGYFLFNDGLKFQWGWMIGFNTYYFAVAFVYAPLLVIAPYTSETCMGATFWDLTPTSFYAGNAIHGGRHEDRTGIYNHFIAWGY